jgi:hypothetical protein
MAGDTVSLEKSYRYLNSKVVKECRAYGISLDSKKMLAFLHTIPSSKITEIVKAVSSKKTPKKTCEVFVEETSAKKQKLVDQVVSKMQNECKKTGVQLSIKPLKAYMSKMPIFALERGLQSQSKTRTGKNECLMLKSQTERKQ